MRLRFESRRAGTMQGCGLALKTTHCTAPQRRTSEGPKSHCHRASKGAEVQTRPGGSSSRAGANAAHLLAKADLLLADAVDPQVAFTAAPDLELRVNNARADAPHPGARSALFRASSSSPTQHAWIQTWPARSRTIRVEGGSSSRNVRVMASASATSISRVSTGHTGHKQQQQTTDVPASMLRPLHGQLLQHLIASAVTVQHIQDIVMHHRDALQPAHIKELLLKLRHIVREPSATQEQQQQQQQQVVRSSSTAAIDGSSSQQPAGHAQALDAAAAGDVLPSLVHQLRQLLQATTLAAQTAEGAARTQASREGGYSMAVTGRLSGAVRGPSMPIDGPASAPPLHGLAAQVGRQLSSGQVLRHARQRRQVLRDAEWRQVCRKAVETLYGMAKSGSLACDSSDITSLLADCQAHMTLMQPAQLSSLAWSLAKLGYAPAASWMSTFYSHTLAQAERCGPRELCTILWAVATLFPNQGSASPSMRSHADTAVKVASAPPAAWLSAWLQRCDATMAGFSQRDLSQTFWALAKLHHRPDQDWIQTALAHAAAAYAPQTAKGSSSKISAGGGPGGKTFNARDTANLLWALASLKIDPGAQWSAAAISALSAHGKLEIGARGAASPHDVSQLLWSIGSLRHQLPLRLLHALVLRLCAFPLGSLLPQDVSTSYWALAVLEYQPAPMLRKRLLEHAVAVLQRAAAAAAEPAQQAAGPFDGPLQATASGGRRVAGEVSCDALMPAADSRSQHVAQGEVHGAAGAAGNRRQLGGSAGDKTGLQGKAAPVASRAQARAGRTADPALDMSTAVPVLMWAVTRLRWADGNMRLLVLAAHVAASQASRITPQGAVIILYGFARARYQPRPLAMHRLLNRLKVTEKGCDTIATPQMLALLLRALGTLQFRPPKPWLKQLLCDTFHLLPKARLTELYSIARGLALLRHRPSDLWLSSFAGCLRNRLEQAAAEPEALSAGQQRWLSWALPRIHVRGGTLEAARRLGTTATKDVGSARETVDKDDVVDCGDSSDILIWSV